MNQVTIHIENYETNVALSDIDLLCVEKVEHLHKVIHCSLVTVLLNKGRVKLKIKFEWKEEEKISETDFLYIPETNILFFRSCNQWGAFDLENKLLKRHERAHWFPYIERKNGYILIQDDLTAESTKFNGEQIHAVPIDPPTDSVETEEGIEYNSPVFGKQFLRTR